VQEWLGPGSGLLNVGRVAVAGREGACRLRLGGWIGRGLSGDANWSHQCTRPQSVSHDPRPLRTAHTEPMPLLLPGAPPVSPTPDRTAWEPGVGGRPAGGRALVRGCERRGRAAGHGAQRPHPPRARDSHCARWDAGLPRGPATLSPSTPLRASLPGLHALPPSCARAPQMMSRASAPGLRLASTPLKVFTFWFRRRGCPACPAAFMLHLSPWHPKHTCASPAARMQRALVSWKLSNHW